MTEVVFHFNVADKLTYARRLARQALRRETALAITAAPHDLLELDRTLWHMEPTDFVAHCHAEDAEPALLQASRITLSADPRLCAHRDRLLNLGPELPAGFDQFIRVVELVSLTDEEDRARARRRWKAYAAAGHPISRHDAAAGGVR